MEVKTVTHEKKNTKQTIYYIPDNSSDSKIKAGRTELLFWHREDGPARIVYNKDGSVYHEEYRINDKLHKEDGPAYIYYNEDGSIDYEEYWINDRRLSKDEWERDYSWKLSLKGTPMGDLYGN